MSSRVSFYSDAGIPAGILLSDYNPLIDSFMALRAARGSSALVIGLPITR